MSWPDGGNTPFKGEKGTTWEGGMRVPGIARWPGVIKPGTIVNDIMSRKTGCRRSLPPPAIPRSRRSSRRE